MEANKVAAERGDRRLSITLTSANSIDDCDTDRIEWFLSKPISGVEMKDPSSLPTSVKAEIAAKLARTSTIYVKEFHEDQRSMMRFLGILILLILAVISFLVVDLSVTVFVACDIRCFCSGCLYTSRSLGVERLPQGASLLVDFCSVCHSCGMWVEPAREIPDTSASVVGHD